MRPKISVIIPAYNEEKLIGKCLKALQNQSLPRNHYEIIVVDNNSTDRTKEIVKKYGISIYTYTKMQRVAAARQFGASLAKAPILAFMDADSFADKKWLETIECYFKEKSFLMAVCGVVWPLSDVWYIKFGFAAFNFFSQANQFFGMVLPWGSNFAIRKEAFDTIGGYNLALKTYDDAEIGIRVKKTFGKKSIYYSQKMIVYTSTRKQESLRILLVHIVDTIKNYINIVIFKTTKSAEIRNIR